MTEEELAEYNQKALAAWNAWKDVCWVDGIGKPLKYPDGSSQPPVGTLEDASLLRGEIKKSFLRKIEPYRSVLENLNPKGDDGVSQGTRRDGSVLETLDCARVFDNSLSEYEHSEDPGSERYDKHFYGDGNHVRKAKCWKNVVWAEVAESDDEPLKVIRGRLVGPLGVMNQVVEEWLMAEYSCHAEKDPVTGKEYLVFTASADAQTEEALEWKIEKTGGQESLEGSARQSETGSIDDATASALPTVRAESGDSPADEAEEPDFEPHWCEAFGTEIDGRQSCLLLAHLLGVKIYNDPEILDALGIRKSAASDAQKHIVGNLRKIMLKAGRDALEAMGDVSVRKAFVGWIKMRATAEKAGMLILSRVKAKGSPAN